LDIKQLEYVVVLAEEQHFSRAAERCHVTQPTLSGRIRQLEEELEVPIVQRGRRFHGLTREGEQVVRWGRVILGDRAAMLQTLSELKSGLAGRLTLGVIPSASPAATLVSRETRQAHPEVVFATTSLMAERIARDVWDFQIDAGITYIEDELVAESDMEVQPLYTERYRLFVSSDHPWAERDSVTWAEAATLPLALLTPADRRNERLIREAFATAPVLPSFAFETDSVVTLSGQIEDGDLAAIMPEHIAGSFKPASGIRGIDLESPRIENAVGLVAMRRTPARPLVNTLLRVCRETQWSNRTAQSPESC
jgi:DNA-binding transcriptional LysR family regulator